MHSSLKRAQGKTTFTTHIPESLQTNDYAGSDIKKDKFGSKFNRKPQKQQNERKKLEGALSPEQRICFISPVRSYINNSNQTIEKINTPQCTKMIQNVNSPKEQSFYICQQMVKQDQKLNDSVFSIFQELHSEKQRQKDAEIQNYKTEIQQLKAQINQLKHQNKKLSLKLKDLQMIPQYLYERQMYISDITNKNILLAESVNRKQQEKQELFTQLFKIQQTLEGQKKMYQQCFEEWKNKYHTQRKQIQFILKLNMELNQQIQGEKNKKGSTPLGKKGKNNENSVRDSPSQKLFKSKSLNFTMHFPENLPSLTLQSIVKQSKQSKNNVNQNNLITPTKQSSQLNESMLPTDSGDNRHFLSFEEDSAMKKQLNKQIDVCECQNLIKKLRQKVRYSQIENDILKRLKFDTQMVQKDNDKLKKNNKKLLTRIESLTNNFSRSRKSPDSSLQLSLSPKKK